MGASYSTGPFPKEFKHLVNLDLVVLRGKIFRFERSIDRNYNDILYISKKQLQWTFQLNERLTFVLFQRFNEFNRVKIPVIELWGAFCLCSAADPRDKVSFLCSLIDYNKDHFLSRSDVEILIITCTKGLAKLKGKTPPSQKLCMRIVRALFDMENNTFNDIGEIAVKSIQEFMILDDNVRAYFNSIGTTSAAQEFSKLIDQRSEAKKELMEMQTELDEFILQSAYNTDTKDAYLRERGGDLEYIKISEAMLAKLANSHMNTDALFGESSFEGAGTGADPGHGGYHTTSSSDRKHLKIAFEVTDAQRFRRLQRSKAMHEERLQNGEKVNSVQDSESMMLSTVDDASIFKGGCKGGMNAAASSASGSGLFALDPSLEQAMQYKWESTTARGDDKLCDLDLDLLEDLFEAGGVVLSDDEANMCLEALHRNDVDRCSLEDVITWYKTYKLNPPAYQVAEWHQFARDLHGDLLSWQVAVGGLVDGLITQKRLVQEFKRISRTVQAEQKWEESQRLANSGPLNLPNTSTRTFKGTTSGGLFSPAATAASGGLFSPAATAASGGLFSPGGTAASGGGAATIGAAKLGGTGDAAAISPYTVTRDIPMDKKGKGTANLLGEMAGSVRLAAWQRQRQMDVPATIEVSCCFGVEEPEPEPPTVAAVPEGSKGAQKEAEVVPEDDGSVSTASSAPPVMSAALSAAMGNSAPSTATGEKPRRKTAAEKVKEKKKSAMMARMMERLKAEAEKEEKIKNKFKMNINMSFFSMPEIREKDRISALEPDEKGVLTDYGGVLPCDLLRKYKFIKHTVLGPEEESFGSVFWYTMRVKESATDEQANCLMQTAINFWEAIPHDYRGGCYDAVHGDILYLPKEFSVFEQFSMSSEELDALRKNPRVVMVALFSERDFYREFESMIPPGLLATRALRKGETSFRATRNLQELYELSCPFEYYEDRLYGPQEDELGEEGMNPLKFAKLCRQRQTAVRDAAARCSEMSFDELKGHLRLRGLKDTGTFGELSKRTKDAFEKQADLIGFGELSVFGEEMIQAIFDRFSTAPHDPSAPEGSADMSFWDFNRLLSATNNKTLFDSAEYSTVMNDLELQTNRSGNLTQAGLMAYYERVGRLTQDVAILGIGSLDEVLVGEINGKLEYEADALASLYLLTENHTLAHVLFKQYLMLSTSLHELSVTTQYASLAECFSVLRDGCCANGNEVFHPEDVTVAAKQRYHTSIDDVVQAWYRRNDKNSAQNGNNPNMYADMDGWFVFLKDMLTAPGYLAKFIHKQIESLANKDEGTVRSLRLSALDSYGRYDFWDPVYEDLFSTGARSRPGTRGNSRPATAPTPTASVPGTASSDPRTATAASAVSGGNTNSGQSTANTNDAGEATGSEGEDEPEVVPRVGPSEEEVYEWNDKLADALPPKEKSRDIQRRIEELCSLISAVQEKLSSAEERITRNEREELRTAKIVHEKELKETIGRLNNAMKLFPGHATAYYDAVRLYGQEVELVAMGTLESGAKITMKGINFMDFLPMAGGEASVSNKFLLDKLHRSTRRKNAALAAMEREKVRRNMDDKAREKLRQQQAEKLRKKRESEEHNLFGEAYISLQSYREIDDKANADFNEVNNLTAAWRAVHDVIENRYPKSMKLAVCQNGLAVALLESAYKVTDKRDEAGELLHNAVKYVMGVVQAEKDAIKAKEEAIEYARLMAIEAEKEAEQKALADQMLREYEAAQRAEEELQKQIAKDKADRDAMIKAEKQRQKLLKKGKLPNSGNSTRSGVSVTVSSPGSGPGSTKASELGTPDPNSALTPSSKGDSSTPGRMSEGFGQLMRSLSGRTLSAEALPEGGELVLSQGSEDTKRGSQGSRKESMTPTSFGGSQKSGGFSGLLRSLSGRSQSTENFPDPVISTPSFSPTPQGSVSALSPVPLDSFNKDSAKLPGGITVEVMDMHSVTSASGDSAPSAGSNRKGLPPLPMAPASANGSVTGRSSVGGSGNSLGSGLLSRIGSMFGSQPSASDETHGHGVPSDGSLISETSGTGQSVPASIAGGGGVADGDNHSVESLESSVNTARSGSDMGGKRKRREANIGGLVTAADTGSVGNMSALSIGTRQSSKAVTFTVPGDTAPEGHSHQGRDDEGSVGECSVSVDNSMSMISDDQERNSAATPGTAGSKGSLGAGSLFAELVETSKMSFPQGIPGVFVIILQNYISYLRETKNEQMLFQTRDLRAVIYELMTLLSVKERSKAHLEKEKDKFIALPYNSTANAAISMTVMAEPVVSEEVAAEGGGSAGASAGGSAAIKQQKSDEKPSTATEAVKVTVRSNMREQLKLTVKDVHELILIDLRKKRKEEEELLRLEAIENKKKAKLAKQAQKRAKEQAYWDSLDPKLAKKLKYEKQREVDAQIRAKTSRQRQRLYKLIQSDEISTIFAAQAGVKLGQASDTLDENQSAAVGAASTKKMIDIFEEEEEGEEKSDDEAEVADGSSTAGTSSVGTSRA